VLIPILYLKGVSTGDFTEAFPALLGPDACGLSASTVARLQEGWADEHGRWRERDLSPSVASTCRRGWKDDAQCLLVIVGATPEGKKELVGLADGLRESAHSWREKHRGRGTGGRRWRAGLMKGAREV
jgi:transposase-like protein